MKGYQPLVDETSTNMQMKDFGVIEKREQPQLHVHGPSQGPVFSQFDPTLDLDKPRRSFLKGWKSGLYYSAFLVTLVLGLNSGFAIYVAASRGWSDVKQGLITQGDCTRIRRSNLGLHLLTNFLSTVLLSASSYTMQFLSAPTRKAVDRAHAQGRILRIGVPSLSNLRWNGRRKTIFYILLAFSSLPLHLFFNSVFYIVVSANNYQVFSVANYFADPSSNTRLSDGFQVADTSIYQNTKSASSQLLAIENLQRLAQNGQLQRLNTYECVKAYTQDYVHDRTHVLLVATQNSTASHDAQLGRQGLVYGSDTMNNAVLFGRGCKIDPYPWICPSLNTTEECPLPCKYRLDPVFENINYWQAEGVEVDHCLSLARPAECELQFSRLAAAVVICTNILKIAVMLGVTLGPVKTPLSTVGDAIASFLWYPDHTTEKASLAVERDFKASPDGGFQPIPAKHFSYKRERWYKAASGKRWLAFLALFGLCLFLCFLLLGYGIPRVVGKKDSRSLFNLGLGEIHFETLISSITPSTGMKGLMSNIIVANLPQLVLSMLYFTLYQLLISMLSAKEWSEFGYHRKGLRVSDVARGAQRSTHFLNLPYRYILPLLAVSTLLHWLVSQSLFLVVLKTYCDDWTWCPSVNYNGWSSVDGVAFGMCWSPTGVVASIVVGSIMGGYIVVLGWRRFRPGLPLAAGNSAVISAACHPVEAEVHDPRMAAGYLKWGVVEKVDEGGKLRKHTSHGTEYGIEEVWHCAFTTGSVEMPSRGTLCA